MFFKTINKSGPKLYSHKLIPNSTTGLQDLMATISRRRRYFLLLIICCLIYFLFSWYIRKEDTENSIKYMTDAMEDTSMLSVVQNSNNVNFPYGIASVYPDSDTIVTKQIESVNSYDDFPVITSETKSVKDDSDMRLQLLRQSLNKPPDIFGYQSHVTFNPELEFSGPSDDIEDVYVTKETTLQFKVHIDESSDQPKPETDIYHTKTYKLPNMDFEFSGPTESENIDITVASTYPPQHADSKGSLEIMTTMTTDQMEVTNSSKNPALIIDTSGCKIPKMDPFDPTVRDLIDIKGPYVCPGDPLFLSAQPHGIIHLNTTILKKYYNANPEDMQCWYQAIRRKYEDFGNVRENDYRTGNVTELLFNVPLDDEYIGAKCYFSNNLTLEQYFPLVKLKKEIEEERSKIKPPSPLNVILLGIDSVSKLNFMRQFSKTKAFLKNKLSPFDMKGYTKVGDNTFPNLVPLLTGHFVEYYWNESLRDIFYFDNIDLIWKDYAKKGYRTFYAEDSPYTGTFNYLKRGFHDPPTDYYYRPIALAIEQSSLRNDPQLAYCLNSQLETDFMYDYLRNFVKTMGERPYIAFAMASIMTHDYLNSAGYADEPAAELLEDLLESGAFNKSAVVIFSDHGLRFGAIRHTYIGKFEERMPFMYIHFPQWFLHQHPQFAKNLKINQDRLITLFDIHATMKHLLHLNGETMEHTDEIGLSLLNEIPENRTCEDASILQHWCPCNNFDTVPVNDSAVVNASGALVNHINELLQPHKDVCAHLEIAEVTDARLGLPNTIVLKFLRHDNVVVNRTVVLGDEPPTLGDYLITLTTKPGGAVFEGTVRYDAEHKSLKVLGISRINMYGTQSTCINSQKLKIYCFCK